MPPDPGGTGTTESLGKAIAASSFTAYCYDNRNQVASVTTGTTGSTDLRRWKYTYDPAGAIATLTKPASTDSLDGTSAIACSSANDPTGNVTKYRYHESGLLRSMIETNPRSSNKVVSSHYLWFKPTGDRTRDVSHVQNADTPTGYIDQTADYTYLPGRQAWGIAKSGANKSVNETYYYDAAGNVTSQSVNGVDTTFSYDRNRLLSSTASGATTSYEYDGYGRLNKLKNTTSTPATTLVSYGYDGFDRLISESKTIPGTPNVTKASSFDPFDRAALQTVTTGSTVKKTRFNYLGLTKQVAVEERPDANGVWQTSKTFNYGLDGRPLVLKDTPVTGTTPDSTQLYGYNPHGDTEALTDPATGNTKSTYRYSAYGDTEAAGSTGTDKTTINPDGAAAVTDVLNPYRYNAKRYDPTTGKYDMGFRNYDPGLNRFLTRDMYSGALDDLALGTDPWSTNRYSFAGGNPISGIELDGHRAVINGEEVAPANHSPGSDPPTSSSSDGVGVERKNSGGSVIDDRPHNFFTMLDRGGRGLADWVTAPQTSFDALVGLNQVMAGDMADHLNQATARARGRGPDREVGRRSLAALGHGNGIGTNDYAAAEGAASRLSGISRALGLLAGVATFGLSFSETMNETRSEPKSTRVAKSSIKASSTTVGAVGGGLAGASAGAAIGTGLGALVPVPFLDVGTAALGGLAGGALGGWIGGLLGDTANEGLYGGSTEKPAFFGGGGGGSGGGGAW
ncbi:MAG: RHS repeat-associated core domain-containing protein [Nocardioidaceae bacterium]|nr:RHS repeat-associated core domain-containing protein [Nocardioidaceae bacterium]